MESKKYIPGGVNSPVRAFKGVGSNPVFISRGRGSKIYDVDGNKYVDFCMSWGALILGHARKNVVSAAVKAVKNGSTFGCPTRQETKLAKLIRSAMPSVELVRFVSSGTEAVMSAIRLARAYTGKEGIIKFDGCYHGHSDALLVNAGSGLHSLEKASSAGVPEAVVNMTYSIAFNNIAAFEKMIKAKKGRIACVIVEPVPANSGVILPAPGYLQALREITKKNKIVLIFDEVITGFRLGPVGAQGIYGIKPDLTCLGKIIGGGFPAAAFGGRRDIMNMLAPDGPVYQAGTLSGNPVAMAAGAATLEELLKPGLYEQLEKKAARIQSALSGIPGVIINRTGSMFTLFFTDGKVGSASEAKSSDEKKFAAWHKAMLKEGFYMPPSRFEACFISGAHSDGDIKKFIMANHAYLKKSPAGLTNMPLTKRK